MWASEQCRPGYFHILNKDAQTDIRTTMNKTTPDFRSDSRIESEIQRERNERLHNDDMKTGALLGDDLRMKDARENDCAANLHRSRSR